MIDLLRKGHTVQERVRNFKSENKRQSQNFLKLNDAW